MSTTPDPRHEQPGTYAVQDRSNEEELQRLQLQNQMLNTSMGGLLPEQPGQKGFSNVLDVGCGTGGWLIELAKAYPNIPRLFGVDVSGKMLDFARKQAEAEGVAERVQFVIMDALRMLEFPNAYFDLVNHRFGASWLRTWDWPKLLQEYLRVSQPYGVISITEGVIPPKGGNSVALMQFNELMVKASYQSGHLFQPAGDGVTSELARLLSQHGVLNVQTRDYTIEYRAGTVEGQLYAEDMAHLFHTFKPFFQKWTRLPDDYEALYQQMLHEMNQPDFVATANLLTAWGTKL